MVVVRLALASLLLALLPSAGVAAPPPAPTPAVPVERVLAISVDALSSAALARLGPRGTPHLHRLLVQGAGTLNARTQVESTETLPNHTSMVTGRRVLATRRGHGVDWNVHRPHSTVQRAAGHRVASLFSVAHQHGSTALFAGKRKLSIFQRSWRGSIDRTVIREGNDTALVRAARSDLLTGDRILTFVHLGHADVVGHTRGFLTPAYYRAVRRVDALVGRLLAVVDDSPQLAGTAIILTADHGATRGEGHHYDVRSPGNFRIPFVVWGAGVRPGDLYAMNPAYADPGRRGRPGYAGRQPVRNGDLANLSLHLLGLGPVPDSTYDARQRLQVG